MASSVASDLLNVAGSIASAPSAAVEYLVPTRLSDGRNSDGSSMEDDSQPPEASPRARKKPPEEGGVGGMMEKGFGFGAGAAAAAAAAAAVGMVGGAGEGGSDTAAAAESGGRVHLPSPDGATLGGGLTWHVAIVPDDVEVKPCRAIPTMKASEFFGALRQVVEKGDHEEGGTPGSGKVGGEVRWVLPARAGGINGWGAIEYDLELLSITGKVKSSLSPLSYVKRLWDKREEDAKVLKAHGRPVRSTPQYPSLPTGGGGGGASVGAGVSGCRRASSSSGEVPSVRATLLAPAWTLKGWTEDSAGFVYWATTNISPVPPPPASPRSQQQQKLVSAYSSATATAVGAGGGTAVAAAASSLTPTPAWRQAFPRLASLPDGSANKVFFGTNLLRAAQGGCRGMYGLVDDGRELEMAAVHMFAHRYAIKRETPKDKLTYHAFCLVQWTLTPAGESGGGGGGGGGGVSVPFSTVVELAWYQGCSGYGSKANWFADKAVAKPTSLCKAMPAALVGPWDSRRSEIRCYDVPMATPEDMSEYLKRYTGANERFLVPVLVDSATVRLSHRSQADLAQYLLNYVGNDPSYHEESRNCQTLAADLFGFLAGKKGVEPYHKVNRLLYKPRHWQFLYTPKEKNKE